VAMLVAGITIKSFIEDVDAHWNSSLNYPNVAP
jgi:hypothetical protein